MSATARATEVRYSSLPWPSTSAVTSGPAVGTHESARTRAAARRSSNSSRPSRSWARSRAVPPSSLISRLSTISRTSSGSPDPFAAPCVAPERTWARSKPAQPYALQPLISTSDNASANASRGRPGARCSGRPPAGRSTAPRSVTETEMRSPPPTRRSRAVRTRRTGRSPSPRARPPWRPDHRRPGHGAPHSRGSDSLQLLRAAACPMGSFRTGPDLDRSGAYEGLHSSGNSRGLKIIFNKWGRMRATSHPKRSCGRRSHCATRVESSSSGNLLI